MMRSENMNVLTELGVKDSKLLTAKQRELLYPMITQLAEKYYTVHIMPCQIDKVVESTRRLHKLNRLEAQTMAQVIEELKPDEVFVDAADTVENRFGNHIRECLKIKTKIVSRHKADRLFPVVSAASVIAKVERDNEVSALRAIYGDFGSGYLTDDKTLAFLKRLIDDVDEYPSFVRKSWKPARRVKSEKGMFQTKLV